MARAIRLIEKKTQTEAETQAESLGEILKAVSDNREAITQFLDILGELHKSGVLDIAQGVMKNRAQLGAVGFEFIKVANIPIILKNLIIGVQFLGRLDPKKTQTLMDSLSKGIEQAGQPEKEHKSMLGLLGMLRDPDVKASMSTALHFLQGMGAALSEHDTDAHKSEVRH
jgi:uncharacterized protein YjgD (DUF1641 family)